MNAKDEKTINASESDYWFEKYNDMAYLRDLADLDRRSAEQKAEYYKNAYEEVVEVVRGIGGEITQAVAEELRKSNPGKFWPSADKQPANTCLNDHFVYIGRKNNTEEYKIGITSDIENRIKSLKTGCPDFNIIASLNTKNKPISFRIERGLHASFAEQCIGGEWFSLSEDDVKWIIEQFRFSRHLTEVTQ